MQPLLDMELLPQLLVTLTHALLVLCNALCTLQLKACGPSRDGHT